MPEPASSGQGEALLLAWARYLLALLRLYWLPAASRRCELRYVIPRRDLLTVAVGGCQ